MHWIERKFRQLNPEYLHRWEVYEAVLMDSIKEKTVWLDIGCGRNEFVARFGSKARSAMGIDILDAPDRYDAPFIQADLRSIPLPSGCASLITMRLVVEHLENIPQDFAEIRRLLCSGGRLLILTTNTLSPLIFLPRLLPYALKQWIIRASFGIESREIFPTFHRFNTSRAMSRGVYDLKLIHLEFLEQVPLHRPVLAFLFGMWYTIVKHPSFQLLRSNLLATFMRPPHGNTT